MNWFLNVLFSLAVAALCFAGVYRSVTSGVMHLRFGLVRRAETPLIFWTLVVMFGALGLLFLDPGLFLWVVARI